MGLALLLGHRTVRGLDAAAALTVAVFGGIGAVAGAEVSTLAGIGRSLIDAASAMDQIGRTLADLETVPLVGSSVGPLADQVSRAASEARIQAASTVSAVHAVAVAVGAAIVILPLPLVACYLAFRVSRARSVRTLQSLLAGPAPADPVLVAQLAWNATARLPYARLREVSANPWHDLSTGRHHLLAAAELQRLGVAAPPDWPGPPPAGRPR